MKKDKKPDQILELEKVYNITLEEVDSINKKGYLLDEDNNIIGLNLSDNQISKIENLKELESLQRLDLSNNQISKIENLKELESLQLLYLENNQISKIENLKELESLQLLYLENNQISKIENLKELESLQRLDLSNNQISKIENLKELQSLRTLYLYNNQISKIENLKELQSLRTLYLYNNQISKIENLKELQSLQTLYLSYNQISKIENLKELQSLQRLDLSNNQISKIENLKELQSLQRLDLEHNQISKIDEVKKILSSIPNLKRLLIYQNPFLEEISDLKLEESILGSNLQDLKDYFKGIEDKSAEDIKLIKKIMLLGNHDSGKSTFLSNFLEEADDSTGSTHILNIVPYPNEKKTEAILYDFGGQDYYHGLYKAFMTNHSTSLLFWQKDTNNNKLSDDKSDRTEYTQNFTNGYWIKQLSNFDELYSRSDDEKKVLNRYWLIQTHIDDDGIIFLDDEKLSPYIFKQFQINAKNSKSLDFEFLKRYLQEEIKNRDTVKKSAIDIEIEDYILKQKSKDSTNLSVLEEKFLDNKDRVEFILNQLSRQGLILYYPHIKSLSSIAWFNPSATIKMIHSDIFSANSIKEYKGRVPQDKFETLCKENNSLILMLIENKVIFFDETSDIKNYYIIPSYLPRLNEDSVDYLYLFDIQIPFLTIKFEYFIPFGFINRLISAYGKTPDVKKYWRDMLLFTLDKTTKIFIKLDFESLQIKLYVIGNDILSKRGIEQIQRGLFEDMIMFYKDINSYKSKLYGSKDKNDDEFIKKYYDISNTQLPEDLYLSIDGKHFVQYSILDDEDKTKDEILGYELKDGHIDKEKVKTLFTRGFKNFTIKNKGLNKMNKIFISYSRKDVDFRDELRKHLSMLKTFDIADNWACEDITIGKWDKQIQKELEDSDLIIYMLSANFFTSSYILEKEVLNVMESISKGTNTNTKILPIVVSEFIGLDKLGGKIEDPNDIQKAILGISDYQYLPYGKIINPLTNQTEERIISLKEYANKNQLEEALKQIVESVIKVLK